MRRTGGLTVMELLVVLGILVVLAAVLFPVLSRARAAARTANCVGHLRQIAQAQRMYSDDHDRTFVPARTLAPGTGTRGVTWCVLLQPYIKSEQILICPDDPDPRPTASSICLPHSYGVNYLLSFNAAWGGRSFVSSLSHVKRPSEVVSFFEIRGSAEAMGGSYVEHRVSRVDPRHDGMGNFAFLDGHIKKLSLDAANSRLLWDPLAR